MGAAFQVTSQVTSPQVSAIPALVGSPRPKSQSHIRHRCSTPLVSQQTFTEHLLCADCCPGCCRCSKKTKHTSKTS